MTIDTLKSIERIGRDGFLRLEYERVGGRTVLRRSSFRNPLQSMGTMRLDDGEGLCTVMLNPSGGLVAGDRLSVQSWIGADCRVLLTTPSATRVYRSLGAPAVQTTDIEVGPDAVLEWLPDTVIPYAGSYFQQSLTVRLAAGSTLILWDAYASGRVARGERWRFGHFRNEIRITASGGREILERFQIMPEETPPDSPSLGEAWDYFASLYAVSDRLKNFQSLLNSLASVVEGRPGRVYGGVSETAAPGVVVRLAARSAADLSAAQQDLWKAARLSLLGSPPPFLRKY